MTQPQQMSMTLSGTLLEIKCSKDNQNSGVHWTITSLEKIRFTTRKTGISGHPLGHRNYPFRISLFHVVIA
ncbi:hypothetical protein ACE6H2_016933 [Prunus campanulata]